jgi:hypothetical protein
MCFSANASFAAAGALSVVGLLSIRTARHNKKLIPLAATPLIFGVQQACEGLVWITINNGDSANVLLAIGTYGFIFFAGVWWPIWIPFSLYIAERLPKRKELILKTLYVGVVTAMLMFTTWILQTTGAEIVDHHLNYPVPVYSFDPANGFISQIIPWASSAMYLIATIMPFFISSMIYAKVTGIMVSIGLIIAYTFYVVAFGSVWCFFEAVSSMLLYLLVRKNK